MTQQELLKIAEEKHWNLEKMRFFIGENREEPKCFGVYQDGEEWVCYKNKADGQHVEHFRGSEEQAVQILYDKIRSEIRLRVDKKKQLRTEEIAHIQTRKNQVRRAQKISTTLIRNIIIVLVVVLLGLCFWDAYKHPNGYYLVDDSLYYETSGDWYGYDDSYGWYAVDEPMQSWYDSPYDGDTYAWDNGNTWENSEWAETYQTDDTNDDYNYDDDDDYDYDTDDWDTGDTDWDTDW